MVEFLVANGADVDVCDNEGWTPLHATASCGFSEIARSVSSIYRWRGWYWSIFLKSFFSYSGFLNSNEIETEDIIEINLILIICWLSSLRGIWIVLVSYTKPGIKPGSSWSVIDEYWEFYQFTQCLFLASFFLLFAHFLHMFGNCSIFTEINVPNII